MKQKIFNLFVMVAVFCLPLMFTSCEQEVEDVYYSMGFEKFQISSTTTDLDELFDGDIETIEDTFQKALGVSDNMFVKHGTIDACDDEVVEKCKQAEETLKNKNLNGEYVFVVNNANTGKKVYTFKFDNTKK